MCGIVGFISLSDKDKTVAKENYFRRALFLDTLRGFDSTGFMAVPFNESFNTPIVYKRALAAPDFLQLRKSSKLLYNADNYFALVGHNRAATQGGVNDNTAHPFTHKHITLVHNGTLDTRHGLSGRGTFTVDSEDICNALSKVEDPKEVLEKLDGAYVLIWHNANTGTIHMARNKGRPLYFGFDKDGQNMLFASEEWIIRGALGEKPAFSMSKYYLLKDGLHIQFNESMLNLNDHELEEFKVYEAPVRYNYNNNANPYGHNHYGNNRTLEDYGYWKGERLRFKVDEISIYPTTKHQGLEAVCTVYGKVVNIQGMPKDPIISYGVKLKVLTGGKKWKDEMELDKMIRANTFIGEASIGTVYHGRFEIQLANIQQFIHSANKKQEYPEPKDVDLPKLSNNSKVLGPDGTFIKVRAFKKLVQEGCAWCTGNIYPEDADEIIWTDNKQPVCPDCIELEEETNVIHLPQQTH